jgi:ribosome-associated protein
MNALHSERDQQSTFPIGERRFDREQMAILSVAAAMDKKAFRPVLLDLRTQGAFTEYFAIVSASNSRQVSAVAEGVRMFFKHTFGLQPLSVDGMESQTWVLLDYGFLFVHVFQDPTRELYQLEQLWSKGRLVSFTEESANALYGEVRTLAAAAASTDAEV